MYNMNIISIILVKWIPICMYLKEMPWYVIEKLFQRNPHFVGGSLDCVTFWKFYHLFRILSSRTSTQSIILNTIFFINLIVTYS